MLYKNSYRALKKVISIKESYQKMVKIPDDILRFTPHPYESVGAKYGSLTPFYLREDVVQKLVDAQELLDVKKLGYRLKIFDAYRPLSVQYYMIACDKERLSQEYFEVNFNDLSVRKQKEIEQKVLSFWSPIEDDYILNPPPHATGAAVDLSIVDRDGIALNMGTKIDSLEDASSADYYVGTDTHYEKNRALLREVMCNVGFTQLPTEWWHFSYGDQIWAVDNQKKYAIYGLVEELEDGK